MKLKYAQQFSPSNIPKDVDAVISSAAYLHPVNAPLRGKGSRHAHGASNGRILTTPGNNPEILAAIKRKLPVFSYPEVLGPLTAEYQTIAVTGSHGKSTTSALLAWVLTKCGADPTAIIGSRVNEWNANARIGKSQTLVIEADEYREAFLKYHYVGGIITSIDYDHPDYFKNLTQYERAFRKFAARIPKTGFLVVCGADKAAEKINEQVKKRGQRVLSYGFGLSNNLVLQDKGVKRQTQMFSIVFNGEKYNGAVPFVGKQYVLNSGAVLATGILMGLPAQKILKAISSFPGIARRLEVIADKRGLDADMRGINAEEC